MKKHGRQISPMPTKTELLLYILTKFTHWVKSCAVRLYCVDHETRNKSKKKKTKKKQKTYSKPVH